MSFRNWLGQEIEVGDIVYKARRDGNATSETVGRVDKINPKTGKVTVEWWADPVGDTIFDRATRTYIPNPSLVDGYSAKIRDINGQGWGTRPSKGTNEPSGLILLPDCPLKTALVNKLTDLGLM